MWPGGTAASVADRYHCECGLVVQLLVWQTGITVNVA